MTDNTFDAKQRRVDSNDHHLRLLWSLGEFGPKTGCFKPLLVDQGHRPGNYKIWTPFVHLVSRSVCNFIDWVPVLYLFVFFYLPGYPYRWHIKILSVIYFQQRAFWHIPKNTFFNVYIQDNVHVFFSNFICTCRVVCNNCFYIIMQKCSYII